MSSTANEIAHGFEALWPDRGPRMYFDTKSVMAEQILSALPVEVVDSAAEADILWMRTDYDELYDKLAPQQAINHIPFETSIIRKADLARTLHRYGAANPQADFSHADFMPSTYCLSDPQETAAFMAQLSEQDHPENLWIMKPSSLSSGKGMKILWDFAWLRDALRQYGEIGFTHEGKVREYVIQRYIKNVLLLEGRKSEIRVYWLIASLDPLLVLMYPEGLARLPSQPYKLDDFDNPLIHITNGYQQRKHGGHNLNAILKWSFPRIAQYLVKEKGTPPDYLEQVLRPRLKQCLAYVVRASIEDLKRTPSSGHFFGLYGADFILDDELTPWLTEVQKGPSLSLDDPVQAPVVRPMLEEGASIVMEILGLKRKGRPLTDLSSTRSYEWLVSDPESAETRHVPQ